MIIISAYFLSQLQSKVEILEKSLSQVVREFEYERENLIKKCKSELESNSMEVEQLRRAMELRNKEAIKMKRLAKNILQQRDDIEQFFLDSLDYVRKQILTNRCILLGNSFIKGYFGEIIFFV